MHSITFPKAQQGFTLVELAIVMIIIGLLIGGILKGQELVSAARTTSTVAQIKAIDAATSGFRDKYNAVPGDMTNPDTRLPNCAAAPCASTGANGNGRVDVGADFANAPTDEGASFFAQLSVAELLGGVNPSNDTDAWGAKYPEASVGGGFHVGFTGGGAALPNMDGDVGAGAVGGGHYLALHGTPDDGVDATGVLSPSVALRIDTKIDNGVPTQGSVLAAGANSCAVSDGGSGFIYDTTSDAQDCNLYIRIQQ